MKKSRIFQDLEEIAEEKEQGTLSEEEAATREIRLDELRAAQEKAKAEAAAKSKEKSAIRQTVKRCYFV